MNGIRHQAKTFGAMVALTVLALASFSNMGFAAAAPKNLVAGVAGPVSSSGSWSGYSAVNAIYGANLNPITNPTTWDSPEGPRSISPTWCCTRRRDGEV
jgi:hypothetical protein